ncbi:MAG: hypothetical protein OEV52_05455, partial [Dehalococcoidia bacterium]|nr:hypothetical protein [Dehalococcoidia bacterium]
LQTVIEHGLVVHCHEFYFAFPLAVNETSLVLGAESFSPHAIIRNTRSNQGMVNYDNRGRRRCYPD